MSASTLTRKGQTTIPIEIRKHLGIHAGDQIEFYIDEDGRVILIPITNNVSDLKGLLPKPKKPVSVDSMNKVIKKRGGKYDRD